ncbi:YdcF family protein [Microbacterium jejuense]|uniref:YdcF family protein n=1 Tax=Microbacterium jejuense TaxID=1263637 RepID=A0ABS7HL86_9MICO|nr:YdcF family protein [Microbacterium jejuense]MBW9093706.1 YdcF family protein [Microbacterium jejuense]
MRRLLLILAGVTAAAAAALVSWAEVVHWRTSRQALGDAAVPGGREAVVVLGYRNTGTRANFVNRHRVRVGLRSQDPEAPESVLVLCGGAVGGDVPEAELMARYARERGYAGPIHLDTQSRTTAENIRFAVPLVEDADTIKIVSHAPHAVVGREYLWAMRPDLAARLVRGDDHRVGEAPVLTVAAAIIARRHRARRRRA